MRRVGCDGIESNQTTAPSANSRHFAQGGGNLRARQMMEPPNCPNAVKTVRSERQQFCRPDDACSAGSAILELHTSSRSCWDGGWHDVRVSFYPASFPGPKPRLNQLRKELVSRPYCGCPSSLAGSYPFRPCRIHHIARLPVWRAEPASREAVPQTGKRCSTRRREDTEKDMEKDLGKKTGAWADAARRYRRLERGASGGFGSGRGLRWGGGPQKNRVSLREFLTNTACLCSVRFSTSGTHSRSGSVARSASTTPLDLRR